MSKRQQLCLIAILIPLLYLSGIPSFWKGIVFALIGIYLLMFAYRTRIESVVVSYEEVRPVTKPMSAAPMEAAPVSVSESVASPITQEVQTDASAS